MIPNNNLLNQYNPNSFTTLDALIMDAILERKPEISFWHIKAKREPVATAFVEQIWEGTFGFKLFLNTAETMTIVSTNGSDSISGAGAQRVKVWGINADGNFQVEIVDMDGVTPVVLANQYVHINRAEAVVAGSTGTNLGNISIIDTSFGLQQEVIADLEVLSKSSFFQVAEGYTAIPLKFYANVRRVTGGGRRAIDFTTRVRTATGIVKKLPTFSIQSDGTSYLDFTFTVPLKFQNRDTVFIDALAETNNTGISFFGFLAVVKGNFDFNDID